MEAEYRDAQQKRERQSKTQKSVEKEGGTNQWPQFSFQRNFDLLSMPAVCQRQTPGMLPDQPLPQPEPSEPDRRSDLFHGFQDVLNQIVMEESSVSSPSSPPPLLVQETVRTI